MRRRLLWMTLCLAMPGRTFADTCGPVEGFDAVYPVPGSRDVPVNARVRVRYPLGEFVDGGVIDVVADGEAVEGTMIEASGARELEFAPALSFLQPGTEIEATAPTPEGDLFDWSFQTAEDRDVEAPALQPVDRAKWEWLGGGADDDPCGPRGLVRYQVSIYLPPARDDVERVHVEYPVFRMNGPDVGDSGVLEGVGLDDGRGDLVEARVYLPADDAYARRLCFTVAALDVAGNFTPSADESCVTLEEGPFFRSCAAAPGRAAGAAAGLPAAALVLLLLGRKR